MTRVTITMPEDTRRKVERAAQREGKSFSAMATELIEARLAAEPAASPFEALIGAVDDPDLPHGCDLEEALKEHWANAARSRS